MKSSFCYLIVTIFLLAGCTKDTVNTKPSLTLKSVSPNVVPINGGLQMKFTFGDKESDADTLYIYRTRLNIRKAVRTLNDSIKLAVPDYDKNLTGEINIDFYCKDAAGCSINYYQNYLISAQVPPTSGTPARNEADSMLYKFVLKDRQKNISDTVYYSPIVIIR